MKTPNIFISHQWRYNAEYYSLKDKFNELGWYHLDYSVPEHNPLDLNKVKEIEMALKEQIRQCNFFIVFSRIASIYSEWVVKEVNYAVEYDKHRLGVRPHSYRGNDPLFISQSCKIVKFNTPAIIRKIEETLNS
jgi:hypothetical protein